MIGGHTYSSFGDLVRSHRLARGWTQEDLATRAGLSVEAVGALERGTRRRAYRSTVQRLSDALVLDDSERQALMDTLRRAADARRARGSALGRAILPAGTPLVGRQRELAQITEMLLGDETRLLTLTGPGGIGKTRLALAAASRIADRYRGGVAFAALDSLTQPELVGAALASALGASTAGTGMAAEDAVRWFLAERQMLVVLDCFEHLMPARNLVAQLVRDCPNVRIVVTSREILHLSAEREYPVPPLPVPPTGSILTRAEATRYDALLLFEQNARDARPEFVLDQDNLAVVSEICARLDGLPLAIELAAARIRILPPRELLDRLSDRLSLLRGGSVDLPTRQQTIRSTIDWSYSLLDSTEQRLLARLSVFVGGCSLEAALAVGGLGGEPEDRVMDTLGALVDKSLVRQDGRDTARFRMLDTIAEYARERLREGGEWDAAHDAHARYYLELASSLATDRMSPARTTLLHTHEREHANVATALDWLAGRGRGAEALHLLNVAAQPWKQLLRSGEIHRWYRRLEPFLDTAPVTIRARALLLSSTFGVALARGDPPTQRGHEAIALIREHEPDSVLYDALLTLAGAHVYWWSSSAEAEPLLQEALEIARRLHMPPRAAALRLQAELTAYTYGDVTRGRALFEQSLALETAAGSRPGIANSLHALAWLGLAHGDAVEAALDQARRAAAWYKELHAPMEQGNTLYLAGVAALLLGDGSSLHSVAGEALGESRLRVILAYLPSWLRLVAAATPPDGDVERAGRLCGRAAATIEGWSTRPPEDGVPALLPGVGQGWGLVASFGHHVEERIQRVAAQVGPEAWEQALQEGRAMSEEAAIRLALRA